MRDKKNELWDHFFRRKGDSFYSNTTSYPPEIKGEKNPLIFLITKLYIKQISTVLSATGHLQKLK